MSMGDPVSTSSRPLATYRRSILIGLYTGTRTGAYCLSVSIKGGFKTAAGLASLPGNAIPHTFAPHRQRHG